MSLIVAEDLITTIRDDPNIDGEHFARMKRHINDAPSVDAVEVVRCKYCKHRYSPNNQKRKPFCTKQFVMDARDDDFCSYGERKDNG